MSKRGSVIITILSINEKQNLKIRLDSRFRGNDKYGNPYCHTASGADPEVAP